MLFEKYLMDYRNEVKKGVKQLFKAAIRNQSHEGDVFLISIHGFFQKEIEESKNIPGSLNLSPYVFGPGSEGWKEEHASNIFYRRLRNNIQRVDPSKFYKSKKDKEHWEEERALHIQLEMYMYIKFWESDMILKKLTQLTRLANREYYKWELDFKENNRRGEFIEQKIINKIKDICPKFYALIESIYDQQLRNAIAHSQYFFMGETIQLTNYGVNGISQRKYYTIEEWDILINKFVMFYDLLNYYVYMIDAYFIRARRNYHFGQQVRIIKKGQFENPTFVWIKWFEESNRWIWYKTWSRHYRLNFFIT